MIKEAKLIPICHSCIVQDAETDGKAFAILVKKRFLVLNQEKYTY